MHKPPIKNLKIVDLYGDRDISCDFKANVKIIVGENGTGKTTFLKILHNVLLGTLENLETYNFSRLELTFLNNKKMVIAKDEILQHRHDKILPPRIWNAIGDLEIRQLVQLTRQYPFRVLRSHPRIRRIVARYKIPTLTFLAQLEKISAGGNIREGKPSSVKLKRLQKIFNFPAHYFPTYRRVEADLENLGIDEEDLENMDQSIHFGMKDVASLFRGLTRDIKSTALEAYSTFSGRILTDLAKGLNVLESQRTQIKNKDDLSIVLARVGGNISDESKTAILKLAGSDEVSSDKYDPFVYFLSNLVKTYEKQKKKDLVIKTFVGIVNEYLVDKEITYDERKVSIDIFNTRSKHEVDLEDLSSGEKQLVSILSKLYLGLEEPVALLFDEPELSLSIEWQKSFLADIIRSGNCAFLVVATHSPFIFDNELDKYAGTLEIKYKKRKAH